MLARKLADDPIKLTRVTRLVKKANPPLVDLAHTASIINLPDADVLNDQLRENCISVWKAAVNFSKISHLGAKVGNTITATVGEQKLTGVIESITPGGVFQILTPNGKEWVTPRNCHLVEIVSVAA